MDETTIGSAVFFPRPDDPWGPEATGAFDHLFHVPDGVRLRLRVFLAGQADPSILFFHGNGETARDYDGLADAYRALPASFLVAEYRGYGPATGRPDLKTFLPDALSTLDEARRLLAGAGHRGPLVVMGRSLGSAPAIHIAARRAEVVGGLIVESGFARIVPLLELIGVPARRLGLTEEMGPENERKMAEVNAPTLILHAEKDEIIPFEDGRRLFAAAGDEKKVFHPVPGAGHNDIQLKAGPAYFARIGDLLDRLR